MHVVLFDALLPPPPEHVFEQSDQTQSDTEPEHPSEECIPSLNDVLAASFVHVSLLHSGVRK